jgi:hypothetical protein
MKISILFTKRKGFNIPSWFFRLIERSEFSHAVILLDTPEGPLVYESNIKGVHPLPLYDFVKNNILIKSITLNPNDDQAMTIKNRIYELLGVNYPILAMIGAFIARVTGSIKNIFADGDKTEYCSEFVFDVLDQPYDLKGYLAEIDGPKKLYEILKPLEDKGL